MNKVIITLILMSINFTSIANPNAIVNLDAHYDKQNNLVSPDLFLLSKAVKAYQDGFNGDAMTRFKQAAAFGNSEAQMYIGLMYLKALGVKRDWAKGYAWIKLSALDHTKKHVELENAIFIQLTPEEKSQAIKEYQLIQEDYSPSEALRRRDRWVHRQKLNATGTRTGSQTVNVQSQAFNGVKLDNDRTSKIGRMEAFVKNYNFGIVTSGEIISKPAKGQ